MEVLQDEENAEMIRKGYLFNQILDFLSFLVLASHVHLESTYELGREWNSISADETFSDYISIYAT